MSSKKREPHSAHESHHVFSHRHHAAATTPAILIVSKISDEDRSLLIQRRAYRLWEVAGKPGGDAAREQFWLEAEKEHVSVEGSS